MLEAPSWMGSWRGEVLIPETCEKRINNQPKLDYKYVAEGRANAVFSIWDVQNPNKHERLLEGTLLRVPKHKPGVTACDYKTLQEFHQTRVEPRIGSQHLVPQILIEISDSVAKKMNSSREKLGTRDKGDGSEVKAGAAMLVQDMRESPGYSVFEFKPKWLAQSPIAPKDAKRCRTCAREAYRNSQKQARGKTIEVPICPLGLLSKNQGIVKITIQRLAPEPKWNDKDRSRLLQAFDESGILTKLQQLQQEGDPGDTLLNNPSDEGFGLAMTLRDCSCYVRIPTDTTKDIEIKLADLDKKNWRAKQDYWREGHENLISGGWYTREETIDGKPIETHCAMGL
ncbi:inositol-pentakisphosphate 2-kinase [Xylariaceae sp. FL0255]|nr:inositol-pentakisphosphate 2-kinase [Xylariaceae sp. FL0255]